MNTSARSTACQSTTSGPGESVSSAPMAGAPAPLAEAQNAAVAPLIAQFRHTPGGLLPLLHAIQDALGYVPDAVVDQVAKGMNRSRAEVHGVITFYHHFHRQPPGQHVVQICQGEACLACGGQALMQAAEQALGCAREATRSDGMVTLKSVYCLGLCASSPAMQIDERVLARVDEARFKHLVQGLQLDAQELP